MDTDRKQPKLIGFTPKTWQVIQSWVNTLGWSDWPSAAPLGEERESSGLGSSRPAILFCLGEIIPMVSDELDFSLVLKSNGMGKPLQTSPNHVIQNYKHIFFFWTFNQPTRVGTHFATDTNFPSGFQPNTNSTWTNADVPNMVSLGIGNSLVTRGQRMSNLMIAFTSS